MDTALYKNITSHFRVNEIALVNEKLKIQILEKDKTVSTMQRTIVTLESKLSVSKDGGNIDQVDFGEHQEV